MTQLCPASKLDLISKRRSAEGQLAKAALARGIPGRAGRAGRSSRGGGGGGQWAREGLARRAHAAKPEGRAKPARKEGRKEGGRRKDQKGETDMQCGEEGGTLHTFPNCTTVGSAYKVMVIWLYYKFRL